MNIIFYIIIFIVGALLGSLYATIIKRMSKEKSIFSLHSYCTKCGERLKSIEKIPILSYIFLKGKCSNCKKPIEIKYIFLEIITALLFLIIAYTLNISIYNININNIISFVFIILYFTYMILAIGLDIEKRRMPSTLLAYGIIISIIYIIYLLISKNITIYATAIYLVLIIVSLLLNILNAKKRAQSSYIIDLLTMILIMLIFTREMICILTITATLFTIAIYILIKKVKYKNKLKKDKKIFNSNLKIVFIIGVLNIVTFLLLLNVEKI